MKVEDFKLKILSGCWGYKSGTDQYATFKCKIGNIMCIIAISFNSDKYKGTVYITCSDITINIIKAQWVDQNIERNDLRDKVIKKFLSGPSFNIPSKDATWTPIGTIEL